MDRVMDFVPSIKDVRARPAELMATGADTPFGEAELLSGRTLQPFSIAGRNAVEVLRTADEVGRRDLRDVLVAVDKGDNLTQPERITVRAAIVDVPGRPAGLAQSVLEQSGGSPA